MKIYLASSWRNEYQPTLVTHLREGGYRVYDFRHPEPGNDGFSWSSIDPKWAEWSANEYRKALQNPVAQDGFRRDMAALNGADVVVLLLPSGRSAHVEAGYHRGRGKPVIVYTPESCEPELMYEMFSTITTTEQELVEALEQVESEAP